MFYSYYAFCRLTKQHRDYYPEGNSDETGSVHPRRPQKEGKRKVEEETHNKNVTKADRCGSTPAGKTKQPQPKNKLEFLLWVYLKKKSKKIR